GASGYSGLEATRLLSAHPQVELRFVASDRYHGDRVDRHLPLFGSVAQLKYVSPKEAGPLALECQAVLLATPAEASLELAPRLLEVGVGVIDLSGAFRLRDSAAYPAHYGFSHTRPELLSRAVYGLPELFRDPLGRGALVANPGC